MLNETVKSILENEKARFVEQLERNQRVRATLINEISHLESSIEEMQVAIKNIDKALNEKG